MKKKTGILVAVCMLLSVSCGHQSSEEMVLRDNCRANMRTIASQEVIYYAENGHYTSSVTELGLGGIECPSSGESYEISVDGDDISVVCPSGHGGVDNGVASWRQER